MEWIKVEKATARKVEVIALASILGIHPDHAFGLCFRFWAWCDEALRDGHARGMTLCALDAIFGHPGFVPALVEVGWLNDRNGALEVPNFDRHLSQSAKNRALAAERAKTSRAARHANVTRTSRANRDATVTKSAPEERRGEKRREDPNGERVKEGSSIPAMPPTGQGSLAVAKEALKSFGEAWHDPPVVAAVVRWVNFRVAIDGRAPPALQLATQLQAIQQGGRRAGEVPAIIDASIARSCQAPYWDADKPRPSSRASGARKSGSELVAEIMGDD